MDDKILQEALEQFEESEDGSDYNREALEDDITFSRLGEQWPDKVKETREKEGRPCLTINKLPAFVRQVVNDARQNKPGIVVSPVDSGADVATAEVISGIIRSIERGSNADVAYDTAMDHAVSGGFGFFRIGIDYAHENSFEMEAKIHRVPNPLMVHWDVNSTEFDASDWNYAFVSDFLTHEQFEKDYPKAEKVSFESDDNDEISHWIDDSDRVRVAEYWRREADTKQLIILSDGRAVREDRFPDIIKAEIPPELAMLADLKDDDLIRAYMEVMQLEETRRRETKVQTVTRRILSGVEVLEEDVWPGSTIPICPVWGEEVVIGGRRHFRSMIRDARDSQTMFNFWRSATTELVALAPRAPWVGEEGFVPKGKEGVWQTANTRSHAYLEYAKGSNPPRREAFAGVPAGALQEALNASDDMKSIIGIYDSSLGARSNETSGKAILARQRESDVANYHFQDNLNRAIQYAAKCLVEIIPHVYTEQETVRIIGEDSKELVAGLKTTGDDGKLYDLTTGKYDVAVRAGPSFASEREEARETLIEIMRQVPGAAPIIGDVLMDHLDFQGADKVAKRLQSLLPPQIQAAEGITQPQGAPLPPNGMNDAPQGPLPQGGQRPLGT